MPNVQELEKEVSNLSPTDLAEFRAWFEEFDAALWDREFEEDAKSGRLDAAAEKALSDFEKGNFTEL
jgi:hypothetical protein